MALLLNRDTLFSDNLVLDYNVLRRSIPDIDARIDGHDSEHTWESFAAELSDSHPSTIQLINYPAPETNVKNLHNARIGSLINTSGVVCGIGKNREELVWAAYCNGFDTYYKFKPKHLSKTIQLNIEGRQTSYCFSPADSIYRNVRTITLGEQRRCKVVIPEGIAMPAHRGDFCRITAQVRIERIKGNICSVYLEACNLEESPKEILT